MECSLTKETHSTRETAVSAVMYAHSKLREAGQHEFFTSQTHTLYTIFVLYNTLSLLPVSVHNLRKHREIYDIYFPCIANKD